MKAEELLSLVRFYVLDVLAWTTCPDWNNPSWQTARASLLELRRLLKISGTEIEQRQCRIGIPQRDR